jgi:hypothetical protein
MALLFETDDRDESHRELAKVLKKGDHPDAECREIPVEGEGRLKYTVWSGPAQLSTEKIEGMKPRPPEAPAPIPTAINLDELARRIVKEMRKEQGEPTE